MKLTAVLALTMALSTPQLAQAADASAFDPWLSPDAAKCVSIEPLKDVAKVAELTPAQFEFARALYIAIPPISHKLPPGDHAVLAVADGAIMLAIVDGNQTCARMEIPRFLLGEIMAVGRGDVIHSGDPS